MQQLRDAAKLHDPSARAVIELVKLMLDASKESLVQAVGDDMLRVQGEAQMLARLLRELTTIPPSIVAQENQ